MNKIIKKMGKKLFWIAGIFLIFSFLFAQPVFRVRLYDTDYTHYLQLMWNENRAANQILNFVTGAADRTITLSGNPTLADWFDQAVKAASTPTFGGITIANGGTVGQAAGPLLAFDDTNNYLEITGCDVGIGTTGPLAHLDVSGGGTSGKGSIRLSNSTAKDALLKFEFNAGTGGDTWQFQTVDYRTAATNLATQMVITIEGNVIVAGTTPQAGYELTVNNNIYAVGDVSALTFTDRTDFFEGDALVAILGIKSKGGKLDHVSLPAFAQAHRKSNIEEEQTVTKTRQKTTRVKKLVSSEEIKLIKGKYTKVMVVQEQEIDELVFEEYDLYNEKGKKILDKDGNPIKHKVPVMEEYQVTEKVKIGEEDIVYRNLGNMVSLLTVGMQQIDARLSTLEARI